MMKQLLPKSLFFIIGFSGYFRLSKWSLRQLLNIRAKPIMLIWLISSSITNAQNGINQTFETLKSGGIAAKSIKPFTLNTNETLSGNFFQDNYSPTFLDFSQKVIQQVDSSTHFLTLTIPIKADKSLELELFAVNIFAPDFKVLNSTNQEIPISTGLYYHGRIKGNKNSVAAISFVNGRVSGMVSDSTGNRTLKKHTTGNVYAFYYEHAINANGQIPFKCDTPEEIPSKSIQNPVVQTTVGCKAVNIYIEADYPLYVDLGASVLATTEYVTDLFNQVAVLYRNESLAIQISAIKVWDTSDPYTGTNTATLISQFRSVVGTSFNGNLAHLFSGRDLGGGRAGIDVLCDKSRAHGVNSMSFGGYFNGGFTYSPVGEIAHEIGHNFGSEHTHACVWNGNNTPIDNCGPAAGYSEGSCTPPATAAGSGTIMSYCHLLSGVQTYFSNGFGTQPGNLIRAKVSSCNQLSVNNAVPTSPSTSSIAATTATLSWTMPATSTNFTVRYRQTGSGTWLTAAATTSSVTVSGLLSGVQYEWQVTGDCSNGVYTSLITFTTYPILGDIAYPRFLFCPGQSTAINLPIEGGQYIPFSNVGTVELSNALGSFASPVIIGSLNGYDGGEINVTIPANTQVGTKYRMRIVMSNPSFTKNSAYDVEIGSEAPKIQAVTVCPESYTGISKIWEKAYGGNKEDELRQMIPANDGGMLLFGSSKSEASASTDKSDFNKGNYDYWLVKIDADKNKQWDRSFGGTDSDIGNVIIPTSDGGYLIGGNSFSPADGDKSQDHVGGSDYWIVKISSNGYKIWDKRYGGSLNDELKAMIQTSDGGFLLAGRSNSIANGSKTKPNHNGSYDYWIIKITSAGAIVTDWVFGGNADETLTSFIQTPDGGYLLGGYSNSNMSGEKTQDSWANTYDYWLVKTDGDFNKVWDERYGGAGEDLMSTKGIVIAADGHYVIAGRSDSNVMGDKNEPSWFNTPDFWVLKINSQNRNIIKQRRFGGGGEDGNNALLPTPDGGFLLAGGSNSNVTGDKSEPSWFDTYDYWIMKVDGNLEKKWNKRFGGGGNDFGMTLAPTSDGNYLIGGFTDSNASGDKANGDVSKGLTDFWIVKFNDCQTTSSTTVNIGQKAFLSATNCSGSVTWSNGATGNHIFVKPIVNTTYTATCFYGCTSANSSTINITVDPCPTTYTLTSPNDDYINAPNILKAKASTGSLSATNKISGTSNVLYEGRKIMLNPGFETTQGTTFKAQIGGCN